MEGYCSVSGNRLGCRLSMSRSLRNGTGQPGVVSTALNVATEIMQSICGERREKQLTGSESGIRILLAVATPPR